MKWFIKCLRHYADFSGRARCREYWMFALFNCIFLFMWVLLLSLPVAKQGGDYDAEKVSKILQISWFYMLGLPGLAVAVRRLHDLGKSGWMMFIVLIPLVGSIWLFVLMCTNGQTGANRFGPDPKTSPETFGDKAKLTSAGIVMIVLYTLILVSFAIRHLSPAVYYQGDFFIPLSRRSIPYIIVCVLMLAAGILLVRSATREQARPALWIALLAFACSFIVRIIPVPSLFGDIFVPFPIILSHLLFLLLYIVLAIMAAILLFAPKNRGAVRGGTITVIVLAGLILPLWCYLTVPSVDLSRLSGIFNPLDFLEIVSWILFAWTFLSKKEKSAALQVSVPERPVA